MRNPNYSYTLLFATEGLEFTDAPPEGMEFPNGVTRRLVDLSGRQALRVQFAHSLSSADVQLRLEFHHPKTDYWQAMTDAIGDEVAPFTNQASPWYSVPLFTGRDDGEYLVRPRIVGNGELDPKFTYIVIDAR